MGCTFSIKKPIEKGTVRFRGVRSHFTLWFWLYGIKVITPDCLSENLGSIPNRALWCIAVMVAEWLAKPSGRNAV